MIGKLSKMAKGKMQTHVAGSEVDLEFLAGLAAELGAPAPLRAAIVQANTARHVLELCREAGLVDITARICRLVAEQCRRHAGGELAVHVCLVDFGGTLLGRHPGVAPAAPHPFSAEASP
jgi:cobalt-precorrin-5B (C1)-methyltransferase